MWYLCGSIIKIYMKIQKFLLLCTAQSGYIRLLINILKGVTEHILRGNRFLRISSFEMRKYLSLKFTFLLFHFLNYIAQVAVLGCKSIMKRLQPKNSLHNVMTNIKQKKKKIAKYLTKRKQN